VHRVRRGAAAAAVAAAVAAPLLLSVLAVLTVLIVLTAPPASAHDELVSVTPKKDAVLTAAPTEVVLVFSEEVEQLGATVVATSSDGTALTDGAPVVDGPQVIQALLPITNATTVTVKYRIVSSDGHPVSGSWSFEIDIPTSLPPTASASTSAASTESSASTASTSETASAATSVDASPAATADDASSSSPWGWVALIAGLVVLAVALVPISRRGRRT
jgi:methionine-rich copper-binding protein CopC